MASQARTYDQKKLLGQVYTPLHIVEKILGHTQFYSNFSGKKILDPACGDGRFLVPVAQFILQNSPPELLGQNLLLINGWDIDLEALAICRENLDKLVADFDIKIAWNLHQLDALKQIDNEDRFDLIIGNPPYIRIQHLPDDQRKYVQSAYSFCKKGSTDAYVAFFQLASTLLTKQGICGFITPNSYFSSETGKALRSFFEWNQNLVHITNYGALRVFENTGTYSAITIFGKVAREHFWFEKCDAKYQYSGRKIPFSELKDNKAWQLSVDHQTIRTGTRLGDICQISVGVATLSDAFYMFTILEEEGNLVHAINKKGVKAWLEKEILKPIIKGSKLKTSTDPITEYILFPYQASASGKHIIRSEDTLQQHFPNAYKYLTSIQPVLNQRDNGKLNAVSWYAFGRAQGLDSSFGRKIIFSPMNHSPNFVFYENPDCTIYSGYFIKYDGDYNWLLSQLNSKRMADFIAISGRDFQGGYKGYNKKILENFLIID